MEKNTAIISKLWKCKGNRTREIGKTLTVVLSGELMALQIIYSSFFSIFMSWTVSSQNSYFDFTLVQFSHSVVSDNLRPHGLQRARLPCPSLSPGISNSVHWVSDAIQPSHPLLPLPPPAQSFPASGSFAVSQLFTSGGQSIYLVHKYGYSPH